MQVWLFFKAPFNSGFMKYVNVFWIKFNALSINLKFEWEQCLADMRLFATCCNDHVLNLFQYAVFEKCQYIMERK